VTATQDRPARLWAECGGPLLTGRSDDVPLQDGRQAAGFADDLGRQIRETTAQLGRPVVADHHLLTERSAVMGLTRNGRVSAGGSTRLISGLDGWFSLSLSRDEDRGLLRAMTHGDLDEGSSWTEIERWAARVPVRDVINDGTGLGLSCAELDEFTGPPTKTKLIGNHTYDIDDLTVLDLSSLWAGPLCSRLLAGAGATVVKVESPHRPDGTRRGSPRLFDLFYGGAQFVGLDFRDDHAPALFRALLDRADVVLTSSRPRALEQLQIDPPLSLVEHGVGVWISITAFGEDQPMRVGFGDDAAVAAGLVAADQTSPLFVADAIADPLTGMFAARTVFDALLHGHQQHTTLSLAGVAKAARMVDAGDPLSVDGLRTHLRPPSAPRVESRAQPLGHDTARWLS
jgi:hypothetical protein